MQPAPADSLQRSCENQDHREFSTLLFPPMLFLLLEFCDPWQRQQSLLAAPAGLLWQLTTCFSLPLNAAQKIKLGGFYLRKTTFNDFYLHSKSTPTTTPPALSESCLHSELCRWQPSSATLRGNSSHFTWMAEPGRCFSS